MTSVNPIVSQMANYKVKDPNQDRLDLLHTIGNMTRSRSLNAVARHYAVTAFHNAGVDNWSTFLSLSDTMIGNMKKTEGNQQVPVQQH